MRRELEWMLDGTCNEIGTEFFYPDCSNENSPVRRVCAECPVRQQCLDYALANGEEWGIWGGTSPNQRRHMPGWTPRAVHEDTPRHRSDDWHTAAALTTALHDWHRGQVAS